MAQLDLKNKFLFNGSDAELKEIIVFLDRIGHSDAADSMARLVISSEQYYKDKEEKEMETERLEEDDFVDFKRNVKDELILWLLNELIEDEDI